jgi:glycosyltransferase involved in cell wall biosynthesis
MRIAYITAGAGGMYCGSCLHDNTLAAALIDLGHDALLIPTYLPVKTDEPDVSQKRVFLGGINVALQQKLSLFRWTPWFLDRLLDWPRLLRFVGRFAGRTRAEDLGDLTISLLRGEHGHQRKEIEKLATWLKEEVRPEIVVLSNVLISGIVPRLQEALGVPIVAMLQGDDIFLEALPPTYHRGAIELIRENCAPLAGFVSTSRFYADFMAGYLALPPERIEVVYPGIDLRGHGGGERTREPRPFTIGYFARICPEKGLHVLVEAFGTLKRLPGTPPCRLRVSGWLGPSAVAYLEEQKQKLAAMGVLDDFEHVPSPDHTSKVRFLQGCDVLSVPTVYREPKGLYVLEAWANAVPVVQPRHGSFPELLDGTGGGLLVEPENPADLANALRRVMENREETRAMGRRGQEAVQSRFHAAAMARETFRVLERHVNHRDTEAQRGQTMTK